MWRALHHKWTGHVIRGDVHNTSCGVSCAQIIYDCVIGVKCGWGDGELRRVMTAMAERCGAQVHGCNDADELGELVRVFGSAHRREYVVWQVIDVVPKPVVGIEKCLYMLPRAHDRVRMSKRRRTWGTKLQ
jgi:hypothetical protein